MRKFRNQKTIRFYLIIGLLALTLCGCTPAVSNTPATATPLAGSLIAFYSDRDGNPDIYIMNADGSEQRRLTDDPGYDDSPALSPDGGQIAFLTARHDPSPHFPDLAYEIYLIDVDGTDLRRLTTTDAAEDHPAWSPDGERIIFDADYDNDGYYEIYTIDSGGENLTRLTTGSQNDQFADWSPDGQRIAFSSDRDGNWDIFVMNADGSEQKQVTQDPDWQLFPAWSPDGTQLAFVGMRPRSRDSDVFVINVDGSDAQQLTDSPAYDENPAWSPDSSQIAFQTDRDGHFEIYAMNRDGSDPHTLTNHPANALWPSWMPALNAPLQP